MGDVRGLPARFRKTIFTRRSNLAPEHSIVEITLEIDDPSAAFVVVVVCPLDRSWTRRELHAFGSRGRDLQLRSTHRTSTVHVHAAELALFLIQFDPVSAMYIIKHAPYKIADKPFLSVAFSLPSHAVSRSDDRQLAALPAAASDQAHGGRDGVG